MNLRQPQAACLKGANFRRKITGEIRREVYQKPLLIWEEVLILN